MHSRGSHFQRRGPADRFPAVQMLSHLSRRKADKETGYELELCGRLDPCRGLLGYDVTWCGRIPTFRRTLLPPSSGSPSLHGVKTEKNTT